MMDRHFILGKENEQMREIRDGEEKNPAPFGSKTFLLLDHPESLRVLEHSPGDLKSLRTYIGDVPISKIVGMRKETWLEGFQHGMTFRDVLFKCLHGQSLVPESLDYFLSSRMKAHSKCCTEGFYYFPQDDELKGTDAYGRKGIRFARRGDYYFVEQGQQRSIMAMFWIFQKIGIEGKLQQVDVESIDIAIGK